MPVPWTDQQIAEHLARSGSVWPGSTITYAFHQTLPAWAAGRSEAAGFSPLTEAQKTAAREVIGMWDDLIAPDFSEVTGLADLDFANSTTGVGYAHAYYPGSWGAGGSVWFNPQYGDNSGTNNLVNPKQGQWGFLSFMHEVGHALGLSHPGNYTGSSTYENSALYAQDTVMYTIMSYFNASKTGADWTASDGKSYYAQTPMLHDILAMQLMYGAETAVRSGNTTYGFNANAGRSVYDFTVNPHPILTIWDGGGKDTIDLSGFNTPSRLNLNPGTYSDCDAMTSNLAIAFGCDIENAIGGSGADHITGNKLANRLVGNGGNDVLIGGGGADTLVGGAGADTLNGGAGADTADYSGEGAFTINLATSVHGGAAAGDTFISIERFRGSNTGNDVFTGGNTGAIVFGNGGNDQLDGGRGNDRLEGGAGDDVLKGKAGADILTGGEGWDRLTGGAGADIFRFDSVEAMTSSKGGDRITDFTVGVDRIDLVGIGGMALTGSGGSEGFSAASPVPELRFFQRGSNTICEVDYNGDGIADGTIVLIGSIALSVSDFIL